MDFDELLDEVCNGNKEIFPQFIDALKEAYLDDYDSFQLIEDLPDDLDKDFLDLVLAEASENKEFTEAVFALVGNKKIMSKNAMNAAFEMLFRPNEGDNDDYNISKCGKASLALNPEATKELMQKLSNENDWTLIYRLVMNESLGADILERLSNELVLDDDIVDDLILASIAMHRNTPLNVLENLAKSSSNLVKSSILLNLNTPKTLLQQLESEIDFKNIEGFGSLNWWDTPTSNWANISKESQLKLGINY
jgi:hypothetical protein